MKPDDIAVLSAVRTPFGKFGGTLRDLTLVLRQSRGLFRLQIQRGEQLILLAQP